MFWATKVADKTVTTVQEREYVEF